MSSLTPDRSRCLIGLDVHGRAATALITTEQLPLSFYTRVRVQHSPGNWRFLVAEGAEKQGVYLALKTRVARDVSEMRYGMQSAG